MGNKPRPGLSIYHPTLLPAPRLELFDRDDHIRTLFPEPLVIQALDELRKGELPWFLPVVGKLPEPLWVHAEFARHLDMRVREVETLPRIDPDLQVARNPVLGHFPLDRKSTRLNSSHRCISYAVFCL